MADNLKLLMSVDPYKDMNLIHGKTHISFYDVAKYFGYETMQDFYKDWAKISMPDCVIMVEQLESEINPWWKVA